MAGARVSSRQQVSRLRHDIALSKEILQTSYHRSLVTRELESILAACSFATLHPPHPNEADAGRQVDDGLTHHFSIDILRHILSLMRSHQVTEDILYSRECPGVSTRADELLLQILMPMHEPSRAVTKAFAQRVDAGAGQSVAEIFSLTKVNPLLPMKYTPTPSSRLAVRHFRLTRDAVAAARDYLPQIWRVRYFRKRAHECQQEIDAVVQVRAQSSPSRGSGERERLY